MGYFSERYASTVRLAEHLFPVFWNEYLFRLNSCYRKGIPLQSARRFDCELAGTMWRDLVLRWRYYVASWVNVLLLCLQTQRKDSGTKPIFTFVGLRNQRFFRDQTVPVRVGLHNLRFLRYPHLLQRLSFSEWIWAFYEAARTYPAFLRDCKRQCGQRNESWPTFKRLTLCGRLRHLEGILHAMALEKYGGEVWFAGHFEMYVSIPSFLREDGKIARLIGCQHGLFEWPPEGRAYEPYAVDVYWLQFASSRAWVERNMIGNPDCEVRLDARRPSVTFRTLARKPGQTVIAFAAQEPLDSDGQIIEQMLSVSRRGDEQVLVLLYSHPLFPCTVKPEWSGRGVTGHVSERHANIDLLVTRYSTLALDYHEIGIPVIFVPQNDGVCVFESGEFAVCRNLEELTQRIEQTLDDISRVRDRQG